MTGESIVIFDAKESVDETAVTHIDFGRLDQTFAEYWRELVSGGGLAADRQTDLFSWSPLAR